MNTALMSAGRSAQPSLLHSSRSLTDREDQLSLGILNFFFSSSSFWENAALHQMRTKMSFARASRQTERERVARGVFFPPLIISSVKKALEK